MLCLTFNPLYFSYKLNLLDVFMIHCKLPRINLNKIYTDNSYIDDATNHSGVLTIDKDRYHGVCLEHFQEQQPRVLGDTPSSRVLCLKHIKSG